MCQDWLMARNRIWNLFKTLKFSPLGKKKKKKWKQQKKHFHQDTACIMDLTDTGIFIPHLFMYLYIFHFILKAEKSPTLFIFPPRIFHSMTLQVELYLHSSPELNPKKIPNWDVNSPSSMLSGTRFPPPTFSQGFGMHALSKNRAYIRACKHLF